MSEDVLKRYGITTAQTTREIFAAIDRMAADLAAAEAERDQFASMLHDCENERDGLKARIRAVINHEKNEK